jgi:hypothetical protein
MSKYEDFFVAFEVGAFLKDPVLPQTTDTRFFAAQIQIPIPNEYLGLGYKGFVFCKNTG